MKYIPLTILFILLFEHLSRGPIVNPNFGRHEIKIFETTIGCAPPQADPTADKTGKFICPLPGLGKHVYAISTLQDSTQFYFNQGINFYYSYHLRESLASFKEAARFDPSAAMPYWGQALSMGPYYNVYTYKMKSGVPAALAAMNSHRDNATAKEKRLLDAMEKRYSNDTTNSDRVSLDKAYANALSELVKAYPDDYDIKALYIDGVMLEHKWDFWNSDRSPKPWTQELVSICETILKEDPHHPAALHYYIHLTEASAQPSLALAAADRLKADMPGAGHMVHMSTHMYQRNGLFVRGVKVNEDANDAYNMEDSLAPMLGLGRNNVIHIYAVQSFCALNAGMYRKGMPVYLRARQKAELSKSSFEQDSYSQFIYMLPVIAWVRLGKWDLILQAEEPDSRWKYATVLDCFARGLANLHKNNLLAAKANLVTLEQNLKDSLLAIRNLPFNKPSSCGSIGAGILHAEILFAEGLQQEAIRIFQKTIAQEDSLIYREPQEWLIPVRQYLGVYLLKMGKASEAEKIYRQDLDRNPGNGWSLLGLYQSLIAQQKAQEAATYKIKYQKAFEACDVNPVASAFQ
jgi:tetratricopeptide (TPR) repeat protein